MFGGQETAKKFDLGIDFVHGFLLEVVELYIMCVTLKSHFKNVH